MTLARSVIRNAAVGLAVAALVAGCEKSTDPEPVPASVTLDKTTIDFDAVGATDQLSATVKDQDGATVNVTVSWSTDASGVATVSGTGLVTSEGNGTATITAAAGTASATATVTVTQVATRLALVAGDGQAAPPDATLPEQLVVEVQDRLDAPVPEVTVDFAVLAGGGSVSPASAVTGGDGRAGTEWTLGSTEGDHEAEASSGTLTGSPTAFTARATNLFIASVTPDPIIEGEAAVLNGQGFNPTPANNTVEVNGLVANVIAATESTIDFIVPVTDCRPAGDVDIAVTIAGVSSNTVSHPQEPEQFVDLAVGEYQIIQDPSDFCLQFGGTGVADAYVFGVGAAAELPNATMPHELTGTAGAIFPSAPFAPRMLPVPESGAAPAGPAMDPELARMRARHLVAENAIREWERQNLSRRGLPMAAPPAQRASAEVPVVNDTIKFRVPDLEGNLCAEYTEITTIVKWIGSAGIFVVDTLNPTQDSLTEVELEAYSDTFDNHIYDQDTLYLGTPTDIDANQRVFVVLTHEVNKFSNGVAGFVFSGDLFSRSSCASSDGGEIFYGHVPDPDNTAGTGARSKGNVLNQMPSLIAHEFAHNIQQSRRLGSANLSRWEAEGQAVFMEEILGHSIEEKQSLQNYGSETTNGTDGGDGDRWYRPQFIQLARYYGFDASTPSDAPEQCTLLAGSNTSTACNPFAFYGAAYAFMRFVSDHYGPSFTGGVGGEAQLHRQWIDKSKSLAGVPNVEALLGVDFDSLFSRWGMMLWADDRIAGADPTITMLSWNVTEIMNSLSTSVHPNAKNLELVNRLFATFSADRAVRGGSTDYSRISSLTGHEYFSVKVRDTGGGILGSAMKPQLWIVREQ
jgi:hypothetical protein